MLSDLNMHLVFDHVIRTEPMIRGITKGTQAKADLIKLVLTACLGTALEVSDKRSRIYIACRQYADFLNQEMPDCPEKTRALNFIRDALGSFVSAAAGAHNEATKDSAVAVMNYGFHDLLKADWCYTYAIESYYPRWIIEDDETTNYCKLVDGEFVVFASIRLTQTKPTFKVSFDDLPDVVCRSLSFAQDVAESKGQGTIEEIPGESIYTVSFEHKDLNETFETDSAATRFVEMQLRDILPVPSGRKK